MVGMAVIVDSGQGRKASIVHENWGLNSRVSSVGGAESGIGIGGLGPRDNTCGWMVHDNGKLSWGEPKLPD